MALVSGAQGASTITYTLTGTFQNLATGSGLGQDLAAVADSFQFSFTMPATGLQPTYALGYLNQYDGITMNYSHIAEPSGTTVVNATGLTGSVVSWVGDNSIAFQFAYETLHVEIDFNSVPMSTSPVTSLDLSSAIASGGGMVVYDQDYNILGWWNLGVGAVNEQAGASTPEPGTWLLAMGAALMLAPGLRKLRRRALAAS